MPLNFHSCSYISLFKVKGFFFLKTLYAARMSLGPVNAPGASAPLPLVMSRGGAEC